MDCPECGAPMVLRETAKFKTADGQPRKFYGCSKYPACKGSHGAHPDGRPLGHPADQETKELRIKCHSMVEEVMTEETAWKIRGELEELLGIPAVHFGDCDKEQCLKVIEYLEGRSA